METPKNKWKIINLAMELGYMIALPIVLFALAGKWLDEKMANTTQWWTLLGILLAIAFTTVWIVRRLKEYIK